MNSELWQEPEKFIPERFMESPWLQAVGWGGKSAVTPAGQKEQLLSFGIGPRQCPGIKLARMELATFAANLFYSLSFQRVSDAPIDQAGQFGITMQPKPYEVLAHLRH
jgi:cytochrome P450